MFFAQSAPPITVPSFDPSSDTYPDLYSSVEPIVDGFVTVYLPFLLSAVAIALFIRSFW